MRTSVETLADIRAELETCLPLHWQELALDRDRIMLDVDWPRYDALDHAGSLLIISLRKDMPTESPHNGTKPCPHGLAGYFIGFLTGHLHYRSTPMLMQDIFWLHPDVRGGTAALRLFRAVEAEARMRSVCKIFTMSKRHRDSSRLFEALGYTPIETVFSKWIGDS